MSSTGFDDNPFGAPGSGTAAPDDNPFADPSVQRAAGNAAPSTTANLDDYNPFDKTKASTNNSTIASGDSTAAVMDTAPPQYTTSGQQQVSAADFQRRQEELERRAQELERREQELRNAPYNARANNWPPLPSFCPFQACFYQDINVDIPVEFQKIVTYLYYLWVAHIGLLFSNMIVGLFYLFAGGDFGQTFGLGLLYFVLFTPVSFVCWFRPAYKAFRDDSSFNFMVFFFVFFFQFMMSCLNFIGIGNTGSCGLILGISEISSAKSGGVIFVGVLMLITALGFGVAALADFFLLVRVHRIYRSTGASMAKAQAEFTSGMMKNESVRQAAADAAQATVRNTFNGNAASGGGGGGQPAAGRF